MAYLFSFWAKTPASGFSVMTILGVISGKNKQVFKVAKIYFKVLKEMVKNLVMNCHIFDDRFVGNDGRLDLPRV